MQSRRKPRSRAPLARLDRNSARAHSAVTTHSSSEEMTVVAPESSNTSKQTNAVQLVDHTRPKIRRSVRVPVASSIPPVSRPWHASAAPSGKGIVQGPSHVPPDSLTEVGPKSTTRIGHLDPFEHVESVLNINRDLGPVFAALPSLDEAVTSQDQSTPAKRVSNKNSATSLAACTDSPVSTKNVAGLSHTVKTIVANGSSERPQQPNKSPPVGAPPVPLWRPTNMATEEEDEITPVQSVARRPRQQTVPPPLKASQRSNTGTRPASLWRPTNMATEEEDEILPLASTISRPPTAKRLQVSCSSQSNGTPLSSSIGERLDDRGLSSALIESKCSKPVSKLYLHAHTHGPAHGSLTSASSRDPILLSSTTKEPEPQTRVLQFRRELTTAPTGGESRHLSGDITGPSSKNSTRSDLNGVAFESRTKHPRNGTRKRARDAYKDNSGGNDKNSAVRVYSLRNLRNRQPVRKPASPTRSHVSLSSESGSEHNSGMNNKAVDIEAEPQNPIMIGLEEVPLAPITLESGVRKQGTIQTYSKRQRTNRTDVKNGQILLPSRRALGIRSVSPSSEDTPIQNGMDNARLSGTDGNGYDNSDSDDINDEKEEEPVMDDMLKIFYMAQRQLWKEVDEISLEEALD